jgi:hypothetical protein
MVGVLDNKISYTPFETVRSGTHAINEEDLRIAKILSI